MISRFLLDTQSDNNQTLLLKSERTPKEVVANTTVVANGIAETNYFTADAGIYKYVQNSHFRFQHYTFLPVNICTLSLVHPEL